MKRYVVHPVTREGRRWFLVWDRLAGLETDLGALYSDRERAAEISALFNAHDPSRFRQEDAS